MSGVFEVRRNFSAVYTHCCWLRYSFEFVIVVEKIHLNFPLSAFLLHKKNFVKNDQNFAVKAFGCALWFPTVVSFIICSGAERRHEAWASHFSAIPFRCQIQIFTQSQAGKVRRQYAALYCRLSRQQNYRRIAIQYYTESPRARWYYRDMT